MRLKKTKLITKLLILGLAVYAVVALVGLRSQLQQKQAQASQLEKQVVAAQQANSALQEDIDALGTEEGILKIAREQLGMVSNDEILFFDSDS